MIDTTTALRRLENDVDASLMQHVKFVRYYGRTHDQEDLHHRVGIAVQQEEVPSWRTRHAVAALTLTLHPDSTDSTDSTDFIDSDPSYRAVGESFTWNGRYWGAHMYLVIDLNWSFGPQLIQVVDPLSVSVSVSLADALAAEEAGFSVYDWILSGAIESPYDSGSVASLHPAGSAREFTPLIDAVMESESLLQPFNVRGEKIAVSDAEDGGEKSDVVGTMPDESPLFLARESIRSLRATVSEPPEFDGPDHLLAKRRIDVARRRLGGVTVREANAALDRINRVSGEYRTRFLEPLVTAEESEVVSIVNDTLEAIADGRLDMAPIDEEPSFAIGDRVTVGDMAEPALCGDGRGVIDTICDPGYYGVEFDNGTWLRVHHDRMTKLTPEEQAVANEQIAEFFGRLATAMKQDKNDALLDATKIMYFDEAMARQVYDAVAPALANIFAHVNGGVDQDEALSVTLSICADPQSGTEVLLFVSGNVDGGWEKAVEPGDALVTGPLFISEVLRGRGNVAVRFPIPAP